MKPATPKKIVFITYSYPPETLATANRLHALAGHFRDKGWNVAVLTQLPNHPQGVVYKGYADRCNRPEIEDGITVYRVRPWIVSKGNFVFRLLSEALFCFRVATLGRKLATDVIYATCPYMFTAFAGRRLAKKLGASFVLEIRDLTWKYIKATGKRTWGVDRILEKMILWAARRTDMLVTTTNGQLAYFAVKIQGHRRQDFPSPAISTDCGVQ